MYNIINKNKRLYIQVTKAKEQHQGFQRGQLFSYIVEKEYITGNEDITSIQQQQNLSISL